MFTNCKQDKKVSQTRESFAKAPKYLFDDDRYGLISNDAKLLYMLLLDRHSLSCKNSHIFSDESGVYVLFSRENMAAALHCSRQKAGRLMGELKLAGLVGERRMGLNKANRIYVNASPEESGSPPAPPAEGEENKGELLDDIKPEHLDVTQCTANETNPNNTDFNQRPASAMEKSTLSIYPSAVIKKDRKKASTSRQAAGIEERIYRQSLDKAKEQIDFDDFFGGEDPLTVQAVESMLNIMAEVYSTGKLTLRIRGENMGVGFIRRQYEKIDSSCIEYVLEAMGKNDVPIRDIRAYLRTSLFNAPETVGLYYNSSLVHWG